MPPGWLLATTLAFADTGDSAACDTPFEGGTLVDGSCFSPRAEDCCRDGCWDVDELLGYGWEVFECAPTSDIGFAFELQYSEVDRNYWFDEDGQILGVRLTAGETGGICCEGVLVYSVVCGQPERGCVVPLIMETSEATSPGDPDCPTVEVTDSEPSSSGCASAALGAPLVPAVLALLARRRPW